MEEIHCSPGTLLRAIHPYSKTRQDELELELNDLVTLLESPEGGWARGVKNLNSKTPESGWFPMTLVEMAHDQESETPMKSCNSLASIDSTAGEGHRKRSRSVSWYNKVFIKNGLPGSKPQETSNIKGRRERSSSAPATSARSSLHFDSPMDPVLDLSDPSLNQEEVYTSKDLPTLVKAESSPEQHRLESDNDRPSSPIRPLLSLKSSFFSPTVNDAVLKEMVYTEWSYLQDLYLIQMGIISDKAVKTLFCNIDRLVQIHESLHNDIEIFFLSASPMHQIAHIFSSRSDELLAYIEYASNLSQAQSKLKRLVRSKSVFRDFIRKTNDHPRTRNLPLEAFLVVPIQRVCKYPLLLKEMIKSVEEKDTASLKLALEKMEKMINLINEGMRQSTLTKSQKSSFKLFEKDGKSLIREEKVQILSKGKKKKRILYLFNDSLMLVKRTWGGKYSLILDIPYGDHGLFVESGEKSDELIIKVGSTSLPLSFSSKTTQKSWMKAYLSLKENAKDSGSLKATIILGELDDGSDGSDSDGSEEGTLITGAESSLDGLSTTLSLDNSTCILNRTQDHIERTQDLEKMNELQKLQENMEAKMESLIHENQELTEQLKEVQTNIKKLLSDKKDLSSTVDKMKSLHEDLIQVQKDTQAALEKKDEDYKTLYDASKAAVSEAFEARTIALRDAVSLKEQVQGVISEYEKRHGELEGANQTLKSTIRQLNEEINRLQKEIKANYSQSEEKGSALMQKMELLEQENQRLLAEKNQLQSASDSFELQKSQFGITLTNINRAKNELLFTVKGLERAKIELANQLMALKKANKELLTQVSNLNEEKKTVTEQLSGKSHNLERALAEINQLSATLSEHRSELDRRGLLINQLQKKIQLLESELAKMKQNTTKSISNVTEQDNAKKEFLELVQVDMSTRLTLFSKLEKELTESKAQLLEINQELRKQVSAIKEQYDKRGQSIKKFYTQLKDVTAQKEDISKSLKEARIGLDQSLKIQSRLAAESESFKAEVECLKDRLTWTEADRDAIKMRVDLYNELDAKYQKLQKTCTELGSKLERSQHLTAKQISVPEEIRIWRDLMFEIEVQFGISEKTTHQPPRIEEEDRLVNIVGESKKLMVKMGSLEEHLASSQQEVESLKEIQGQHEARLQELLPSLISMAKELKDKKAEFEEEIESKAQAVISLTRENDALHEWKLLHGNCTPPIEIQRLKEAIETLIKSKNDYEKRLQDANNMTRCLVSELNDVRSEQCRDLELTTEQESVMAELCQKIKELQGQSEYYTRRLQEAEKVEAEHVFALDKYEQQLAQESQKSSQLARILASSLPTLNTPLSSSSAETLYSNLSLESKHCLIEPLEKYLSSPISDSERQMIAERLDILRKETHEGTIRI